MGKRLLPFFVLCLLWAPAANAGLVDKIAAVVNGEVILLSDVERFERNLSLRRELDPLFGFAEELSGGKGGRQKILDFLVQERLILQTFKVSDQDVEQEIQSVQRNNNLDRDQLMEFLRSKGYTYDDYFDLMRVGLSKRNLLDREIRSRVNVSDDDVRNYYYNMSMKDSAVPLEYSLQLISVNFASFTSQKAAQDAAQDALRAIRQGEPFREVAKRVSDDPSAENGGDLGFLSGEQLAEPLRSAVRKLQIGTVSDLLKSSSGYLIVKLVDARSTESQKLIDMKDRIREQLAKEEYKKQLFIWAERARNNAYVHVN